jgi:uncharacterized protein with HEPN domain
VKDDRLYLDQILERIARIEDFPNDGREAFWESLMMQDAVIRNFEVIGEAVKRLSPELQSHHPDVPWRRIADFRNVLIHDYDEVKLPLVWNIIQNERIFKVCPHPPTFLPQGEWEQSLFWKSLSLRERDLG